jgi:hypothetical protein
MAVFRIPYPERPEEREALFDRAVAALGKHGSYEGTYSEGTFRGTTPIGGFAGTYRALNGSGEMEIVLTKKPWLVSAHLIEHEVRKHLDKI